MYIMCVCHIYVMSVDDCYCSIQVNVLDAAAVGEVLDTFAVCSSPIVCICAVPSFDDQDPDVLASKWICDEVDFNKVLYSHNKMLECLLLPHHLGIYVKRACAV